ncbi:MAG: SUMF1/EgtB/PvdO family nonheme iron enzyme [Pirellulales bacterium]|nr:SUMF1/EgtB/PvdO family nonheme iron enzyme [Pirellulales bacterium]
MVDGIGVAREVKEGMRSRGDVRHSITNSVGMRLVRVGAGEFVMGLPDAGEKVPETGALAEVCEHRVRITRGFLLGAFEVTRGEYRRVMGEGPGGDTDAGDGAEEGKSKEDGASEMPAANVSWVEAVEFCRRLSGLAEEKGAGRQYRLPTEAEWEYACRAGSMKPFVVPEGEEADAMGFNMRYGSARGLPVTKVGSYPANAFGLYDMRGNVFEWCGDWCGWDYYRRSPRDDPQGPSSGVWKVVRGADWRFTSMGCHYNRADTEPWRKSPFIGFRVVGEEGW